MSDQLLELAIKDHTGKVVVDLSREVSQIVLDPRNALGIAEAIAEAAYKADYGVAPTKALANAVVERKYERMCTRVALMMKSLRHKKASDEYTARQIVDKIFSELL